MKDRQVPQTPVQSRVPIISTALHCVSMTVVVFLRSGFGYAYLRPRSIFFASIYAFSLFMIYAWYEADVWESAFAIRCFGSCSAALYLFHLIAAFAAEFGSASHDNHSGTPHMIRLLRLFRFQPSERFQSFWVIWTEPAILAAAAYLANQHYQWNALSSWLLLSAVCLWLKESLNYWFQLRQRKRRRDTMEDAEHGLDGSHPQAEIPTPAPSRRSKVERQRLS